MKSVITSKFQTTIPKAVRESMKLSIKDTLEWSIMEGKVIVTSAKKEFLDYRNQVKTGKGDIRKDIELARNLRVEKYK